MNKQHDRGRERLIDDLATLLARTARALHKAQPENLLSAQAIAYLKQNNLVTPLRTAAGPETKSEDVAAEEMCPAVSCDECPERGPCTEEERSNPIQLGTDRITSGSIGQP